MNFFPFLVWWHRVNAATLRSDVLAGLTGGFILVPQGVAFATIAGMPPEYGLYCAMLPAIVAALWGSSWHLVSGPTTAISIVIFAAVSPLAVPGSAQYISLVLTLTLLVGLIQLSLGVLRLGTLANFISHTVVVGFTAGAAVLIGLSQVKYFFGLTMIPRGALPSKILASLWQNLHSVNRYEVTIALVTVLASIAIKRYWPRSPNMILSLFFGSIAAFLFNQYCGGFEQTGIATIGQVSVGFPPFSKPDFSLDTIEALLPIAIAVSVLALTEAVSIARSIALKSGQQINGNQEFIGQGLSNIAGAFFSGFASSGSFNRSGVNYEAGAKTPLAAVFSALFLLLIVLFLAPLASYLPLAAMAGILFVVAWGLFDFAQIVSILRNSWAESVVLIATFIATLVAHLEYAIFIGVFLSLMLYLVRYFKKRRSLA